LKPVRCQQKKQTTAFGRFFVVQMPFIKRRLRLNHAKASPRATPYPVRRTWMCAKGNNLVVRAAKEKGR
jgi:hypothetical protein